MALGAGNCRAAELLCNLVLLSFFWKCLHDLPSLIISSSKINISVTRALLGNSFLVALAGGANERITPIELPVNGFSVERVSIDV